MPYREEWTSVWAAAHDLERRSLDAWRNAKASQYPMVDALAIHLAAIETTVARTPGGNVWVTVSMEGKNPHYDEKEAYFLQIKRKGLVQLINQGGPKS